MGDVEGIIAALRVVARDAKNRSWGYKLDPMVVNRWVHLLPNAETGCWKHLLLVGHDHGWAYSQDVIVHAEAIIAYLEHNKKRLNALNGGGDKSGPDSLPSPEKTIEAEFTDVTAKKKKTRKLLKQL